ncbi:MAG: hypothetical protein AAF321_07875, partial [Pseudomonadota bacterium]
MADMMAEVMTEATAEPIAGDEKREKGAAFQPAVIAARDLSLTFQTNDGPVHALQGIDLDVAKGDFVSLIGPS